MLQLDTTKRGESVDSHNSEFRSLLDTGQLPVAEIALLSDREGRRPNPIYQAHKWFARRFSSAFRSLLVAARLPAYEDFWKAFYDGVDYRGLTVLDPFVGGGTSVVEANLLGANTVGIDIDPVACAITRFELHAADTPELSVELARLDSKVGERLSRYYRTTGPDNEPMEVLHFFWVQEVGCQECGHVVEAHPHYQLAFEADGNQQWVFCHECHEIHELPRTASEFRCCQCRRVTVIQKGTVNHGTLTCPVCSATEPLIAVAARTGLPPRWRLFAMETLPAGLRRRRVPMTARVFQKATAEDEAVYRRAAKALQRRKLPSGDSWVGIPKRAIPRVGRSDDRLIQYGYSAYHELFGKRQLLHLSLLAEEIGALKGATREALALAFSDHLTTNCMLTYYAFGWRRLAPLFSVRAFRHVSRPIEINPWLDGTGRGTFPNAVRQIERSVRSAQNPLIACLDGGFRAATRRTVEQQGQIFQGDSRKLAGVPNSSVDLILTDPPYFDNIAYSELSDFFLPWLESFGLVGARRRTSRLPPNLAANARGQQAYLVFRKGLSDCFSQMRRVMKDDGRLAFSYQHRSARAWAALATALGAGGFRPVQVFPLLGNSTAGLHQYEGTILWDAVTVCRKGSVLNSSEELQVTEQQTMGAVSHAKEWVTRLAECKTVRFGQADYANLLSAALVAAALGLFGTRKSASARPLLEVLEETQVSPGQPPQGKSCR